MSKPSRALLSAGVAGLIIVSVIGGWTPHRAVRLAPMSGTAVIQAMHDRYAKTWYRTLTFSQETQLRAPRSDSMVTETWEEVGRFPGGLRVLMKRTDGEVTAMYLGDSLYFMKGDSVANRIASRNILLIMGFDVYCQPVQRTLAVLQAEHYPLSPVREDIWQGRLVYVIGGAPGDSTSQQLWIDKERLLFVRAIQPGPRDASKVLDFRFNKYVPVSGGWVAEEVETYFGGTLVQKEKYSDVRTNVPVDSSLFVVPGPGKGKSKA
jgi:hypothetical protein